VKIDDLAGLRRALTHARERRETQAHLRAKHEAGTARTRTERDAALVDRRAAVDAGDDHHGDATAVDHDGTTAPRDDAQAFRAHVGPVAPVRARERVTHPVARPEPMPVQRQRDERAALAATMSDELDVETLLDTDDSLSFRRPGIGADVLRRLRRGHWAQQAEIDLHGLTRDEAREALAAFVAGASQRGARCIRVVHGKGIGSPGRMPVLKGKVRAWLVQNERVIAFVQAPPTRGGHGALMVLLA
jgi:DNA-nicking Smr family endonuclease